MSTHNPPVITQPTEPTVQYRPGVCNIGPAEIERRRRSAVVATVLAIAVGVVILVADFPNPARLAMFPFAAAAAITWLQVTRRFCVAFGAAGILNFGSLGTTESVGDAAARAADRRTARRMIIEGVGYGLLVAVAFFIVGLILAR